MQPKYLLFGCIVVILRMDPSHGQDDCSFLRLDSSDGATSSVSTGVIAGGDSEFTGLTDGDNVLVDVGSFADASDMQEPGSAFGNNAAAATAFDLTPIGARTFVPTVDTTIVQEQFVEAIAPKGARTIEGTGASARADSDYELSGNEQEQGFLRGSIYIVGLVNGTESGSGLIGGSASVMARANNFMAQASYSSDTELWTVSVTLPDSMLNFTTSGVNEIYTFVVPISCPSQIELEATASSGIVVRAGPEADGSAQVAAGLSASAWAQFTPTLDPPSPADFDGDGDIDGADFLIWQTGFGRGLGATLSQGDATQDGVVDVLDLDEWATTFGENTGVAVPESNGIAFAALCCVGLAFNRHNQG